MPMSWTEQTLHFIDFEGNLRSGVLEYGVVTLLGGQIQAARTRLCAPKSRILADETAVHGLRDEDLAGLEALSSDWAYFSGLRSSGPLCAHSAAAENSLLRSVWPYPGSSPDFLRGSGAVAEWGPWIDSAVLAREFFPSLETVRLEELVRVLGLQDALDAQAARLCPPSRCHYHAALYDALAGALVLLHLQSVPSLAGLTLSRVLVLSAASGARRSDLQQGLLF